MINFVTGQRFIFNFIKQTLCIINFSNLLILCQILMASNVTTPTAIQQTPNKLSKGNLFQQNNLSNTLDNGNVKLDKVIIQVLNGESEESKRPMNSPAMLQTSFDQSQLAPFDQSQFPQSPQQISLVQDSVNLFSGLDGSDLRADTKQNTLHSEIHLNEYNPNNKQEQILYNTTEFDENHEKPILPSDLKNRRASLGPNIQQLSVSMKQNTTPNPQAKIDKNRRFEQRENAPNKMESVENSKEYAMHVNNNNAVQPGAKLIVINSNNKSAVTSNNNQKSIYKLDIRAQNSGTKLASSSLIEGIQGHKLMQNRSNQGSEIHIQNQNQSAPQNQDIGHLRVMTNNQNDVQMFEMPAEINEDSIESRPGELQSPSNNTASQQQLLLISELNKLRELSRMYQPEMTPPDAVKYTYYSTFKDESHGREGVKGDNISPEKQSAGSMLIHSDLQKKINMVTNIKFQINNQQFMKQLVDVSKQNKNIVFGSQTILPLKQNKLRSKKNITTNSQIQFQKHQMTQHIFGKNLAKNAIQSHTMNLNERRSPRMGNMQQENDHLNLQDLASRKASIHVKSPTGTQDKSSHNNKISNEDLRQIQQLLFQSQDIIIKDEVMLQNIQPNQRNHIPNIDSLNTQQQATSQSPIQTIESMSREKMHNLGQKMEDTLTAFPKISGTTPINLNIQVQEESKQNSSQFRPSPNSSVMQSNFRLKESNPQKEINSKDIVDRRQSTKVINLEMTGVADQILIKNKHNQSVEFVGVDNGNTQGIFFNRFAQKKFRRKIKAKDQDKGEKGQRRPSIGDWNNQHSGTREEEISDGTGTQQLGRTLHNSGTQLDTSRSDKGLQQNPQKQNQLDKGYSFKLGHILNHQSSTNFIEDNGSVTDARMNAQASLKGTNFKIQVDSNQSLLKQKEIKLQYPPAVVNECDRGVVGVQVSGSVQADGSKTEIKDPQESTIHQSAVALTSVIASSQHNGTKLSPKYKAGEIPQKKRIFQSSLQTQQSGTYHGLSLTENSPKFSMYMSPKGLANSPSGEFPRFGAKHFENKQPLEIKKVELGEFTNLPLQRSPTKPVEKTLATQQLLETTLSVNSQIEKQDQTTQRPPLKDQYLPTDEIHELSKEDRLEQSHTNDVDTLNRTRGPQGLSYYDNKFPALTPERRKDGVNPGKTHSQFYQAAINQVGVPYNSPSPGDNGIVTKEISHDDVEGTVENPPVVLKNDQPRLYEVKNSGVTLNLKVTQSKSPQKKPSQREKAQSIQTGSFNTSQSQYFEKTNTSFKPMYYMRQEQRRQNARQGSNSDALKIKTIKQSGRPILFEEIKKQQERELKEIKRKIEQLAKLEREKEAELRAENPDLANLNSGVELEQVLQTPAKSRQKKSLIAVKNNLRVDISQVIEQTLEQTETGGALQSGFASNNMPSASFRGEQETADDRKDTKYLTSQSGYKNPYPVLNITDQAHTYEGSKLLGTKSSKVTRAGDDDRAVSNRGDPKYQSQTSFVPRNKYHSQGIQSDLKSIGTHGGTVQSNHRGKIRLQNVEELMSSDADLLQSQYNQNLSSTQQVVIKPTLKGKLGQTLQLKQKNSFIEKQNRKQEKFKERFNSSIGQLSQTIDRQRERFNQTTKLISIRGELNQSIRTAKATPKAIQEVSLPKNLDRMALQYQFTSGNRVNAQQNVRMLKEQQKIQLQTKLYEQHKNFENREELIEIIRNATIEKPPAAVQKFDQEYTGLGLRSRSTIGNLKNIDRTEHLSTLRSGILDRRSTLRPDSQVDELFYIKNKVSQEELLIQRPSQNKLKQTGPQSLRKSDSSGGNQSSHLPSIQNRERNKSILGHAQLDTVSDNEPSSNSKEPGSGINKSTIDIHKNPTKPVDYGNSTRELASRQDNVSPVEEMTDQSVETRQHVDLLLANGHNSINQDSREDSNIKVKFQLNDLKMNRLEEASKSGEFALNFDLFEQANMPRNQNLQLQRQTFQSNNSSQVEESVHHEMSSFNSNLNLLYAHTSVYNQKMKQQLQSNLNIIDKITAPIKLRDNISTQNFIPKNINVRTIGKHQFNTSGLPSQREDDPNISVDIKAILKNKGSNHQKAVQLFSPQFKGHFIGPGQKISEMRPYFDSQPNLGDYGTEDKKNTLQSKLLMDVDIVEKDIRQFKNNKLLF